MRQRQELAAVIVAGDGDDAAMARAVRGVAVLQGVGRAVDAGTLAGPDAEDAINGGAGEERHLLTAPDGGRRQILVDAGLEVDVLALEIAPRLPERVVVDAERRAAI